MSLGISPVGRGEGCGFQALATPAKARTQRTGVPQVGGGTGRHGFSVVGLGSSLCCRTELVRLAPSGRSKEMGTQLRPGGGGQALGPEDG